MGSRYAAMFKTLLTAAAFFVLAHAASVSAFKPAFEPAFEVHQRIITAAKPAPAVALTLDACGGAYDANLINLIVANHVSATIFVTKKWLDRNPVGTAALLAHPELFELEDHGAEHIPAVIGAGRRVYGIAGQPDLAHLQHEVEAGATRIYEITHRKPRWYRGATAEYDRTAITEIERMGYRVAGFSVNADAGATLPRREIAARLRKVQQGDIVIAHMNKPAADTAEGFADALPLLLARGVHFVKLSEVDVAEIAH